MNVGELAALPRADLVRMLRDAEHHAANLEANWRDEIERCNEAQARATRAEQRLACWAWSHVLDEIAAWAVEQTCAHCGGHGFEHLSPYGDCGRFTAEQP